MDFLSRFRNRIPEKASMKFDPESALHLLLEQALKNVTLDGYASFLATFFVQFMPVASLVVREFDTNHITQLAHYPVNKTVFSPPRVVTIPDALVYELYLDPDCSGDKYKASILSSKDGTSRTRVFTMLHMAEETSIFFPLLVDDRFLHCFYISISAIGKNKYTEEHLQICESLRIPLANALTVLLQRRSESPLSAFPPLAAGQTFNGAEAPSMMLEEVTTSYIHHVLAYTRGRVSGPRGAARILGIPASTLVSKLRKLGVNPKAYFKAGD